MNGVFNEGERMGLQLPNPPSPWTECGSNCEACLPLASWKSSTNVAPQFLQPVWQGCMHIASIKPWIHDVSQCIFFFPETLIMQKHQMPPGWVAPISNILSAVSRQTAALPGTQKVTNRGFLHTGSLLFVHWIHDVLKIAHQLHAKEAEDALSRTSSHQKFKLLQS